MIERRTGREKRGGKRWCWSFCRATLMISGFSRRRLLLFCFAALSDTQSQCVQGLQCLPTSVSVRKKQCAIICLFSLILFPGNGHVMSFTYSCLSSAPIDSWYLALCSDNSCCDRCFLLHPSFSLPSFHSLEFLLCVWKTHRLIPAPLIHAVSSFSRWRLYSHKSVKHLIFWLIFFLFTMRTHRNIHICMWNPNVWIQKALACVYTLSHFIERKPAFIPAIWVLFFEQNKTNVWENEHKHSMCHSLFILGTQSSELLLRSCCPFVFRSFCPFVTEGG